MGTGWRGGAGICMFRALLHYKVIPFLIAFSVDNPSRAKGTRYYSIHQEEIHFSN